MRISCHRLITAMATAVAMLATVAHGNEEVTRAVYAHANDLEANYIVAYASAADGTLSLIGTYETGGVGVPDVLDEDNFDPFLSQYSLIYSQDKRFLLVVNAGSDTISSLKINADGSLTLIDQQFVKGSQPTSIAERAGLVYVSSIQSSTIYGFSLLDSGFLCPLENSLRSAGVASTIHFSPDGNFLLATVFDDLENEVVVFVVDGEIGLLSDTPIRSGASSTVANDGSGRSPPSPLGFDVVMTPVGQIVVITETRAFPQQHGSVSTFLLNSDGSLSGVSLDVLNVPDSVGFVDPIDTNVGPSFVTACWIGFNSANPSVFWTNSGNSAFLSSWTFAEDGTVSLVKYDEAQGNEGGVFTGYLDFEVTSDGQYLYQGYGSGATVAAFKVGEDGTSLELIQSATGDLPEQFAQGLVVVDLDAAGGEGSDATCVAEGITLSPTASPAPTAAPTSDPFPYPSCTVCADGTDVCFPDFAIVIEGEGIATCSILNEAGIFGFIPEGDCPLVQLFYGDTCGCGTCNNTKPFECPVCADGTDVCNPDAMFQFPGENAFSCAEFDFGGRFGEVSEEDCPFFQGLLQGPCGCGTCNNTLAPVIDDCTLCSGGADPDASIDLDAFIFTAGPPGDPEEYIFGFLDTNFTCATLGEYMAAFTADEIESGRCGGFQEIAAVYCGCPTRPEVACNLCEDGSLPESPNAKAFFPNPSNLEEFTFCRNQLVYAAMVTNPFQCVQLQDVGFSNCGCAITPELIEVNAPDGCQLCEGGNDLLPNPDLEVVPFITCGGMARFVTTVDEDLCTAYQKVVGSYCGCPGVDVETEEDVCRLCGDRIPDNLAGINYIPEIDLYVPCAFFETVFANTENEVTCEGYQAFSADACCSGVPEPSAAPATAAPAITPAPTTTLESTQPPSATTAAPTQPPSATPAASSGNRLGFREAMLVLALSSAGFAF